MDYPTDTGFDGDPEATEETGTAEATDGQTERQPCACGCGQFPARKRSKFLPGHDAQLKSKLYRTLKAKPDDPNVSQYDRDEASAKLEEMGWSLPAGV